LQEAVSALQTVAETEEPSGLKEAIYALQIVMGIKK